MEIEQLRKELNHLLENVIEYSQDLSEQTYIPSLEISVVLAKVNKMQEKLIVLRHLLQEQENKRIKERKRQNEIPKPQRIIEEPLEQEIPLIITNEEIKEVVIEEEHKEPVVSNNEKVDNGSTKKVTDAFSLNDRYLYANELFNKEMSAFNECIKEVENCVSIEEINQLITSTKVALNWDEENEHFISFSETIKRKFS